MDNPSAKDPEEEREPRSDKEEPFPPSDSYPVTEPIPEMPEENSYSNGEEKPNLKWETASPEATYLEPDEPPEPEQPVEPVEGQQAETYSPEATYAAPDSPIVEKQTLSGPDPKVGIYSIPMPDPQASFSPSPPPPPAGAGKPVPSQSQASYGVSGGAFQRKDSGIAMVLEILPGLFGFLGFGWIYAGNTTVGVSWLVGFLLWNMVAVVLDVITLGCFIPLHIISFIACLIISPITLNNYIKRHPQFFNR